MVVCWWKNRAPACLLGAQVHKCREIVIFLDLGDMSPEIVCSCGKESGLNGMKQLHGREDFDFFYGIRSYYLADAEVI